MTTAPARQAAPGDPAALGLHLDAIAAALDRYGITCQVTRPAGTPVLNTGPPAGPAAATAAIDPDLHASPAPQLDCTCVWTPPAGTAPETAAAVIAAALTRALKARGLTGIYTATAARFGLISVTAAVTAWTNGHQIWCTSAGQHYTWPAADIDAVAASLAALAGSASGP